MTRAQFEAIYLQAANDAVKGTRIFPRVVLSAAALESGFGKDSLSTGANNFFGIKAGKSWKGATVSAPTTEYINGKKIHTIAKFRKYPGAVNSFRDYVNLLHTGKRFKAAKVEDAPNELDQFKRIQKAGYATDPNYSDKLAAIYKGHKVAVLSGAGILLASAIGFTIYKLA